MKKLLVILMALTSTTLWAAEDMTASTSEMSGTMNLSAKSRSEALLTDSIFYSLPANDMTYVDVGASRHTETVRFMSSDIRERNSSNVFFFDHSRGLTKDIAMDFGLDYFSRENNSDSRDSGVNQAYLGARSHFRALDMQWIYGAHAIYLPDGELRDSKSKLVAAATIGFEEAVDIARWGLQMEGSTQDHFFFDDQMNLIGFFEIPFVRQMNVGVSAGADLTRLSDSKQANFAKAYARYGLDPASGIQASLRQDNEKLSSDTFTSTEVGLSLNRVF